MSGPEASDICLDVASRMYREGDPFERAVGAWVLSCVAIFEVYDEDMVKRYAQDVLAVCDAYSAREAAE